MDVRITVSMKVTAKFHTLINLKGYAASYASYLQMIAPDSTQFNLLCKVVFVQIPLNLRTKFRTYETFRNFLSTFIYLNFQSNCWPNWQSNRLRCVVSWVWFLPAALLSRCDHGLRSLIDWSVVTDLLTNQRGNPDQLSQIISTWMLIWFWIFLLFLYNTSRALCYIIQVT